MALLSTAGTNSIDLAVAGTYRQDQSELLLSALYLDPSFLGTLQGGEGFSGNSAVKQWNEESLNPSSVTELTPSGMTNTQTTMLVSAADAVVIDNGTVLADSGVTGGISASERIQVVGKAPATGGNYTLQVVRAAQGGPSATTHAQDATFVVISSALPMNSDLGADKTKPRLPHYNYLQREDINVNLGSEAIDSSLLGYTPGVPNEFHKQIRNRLAEKMIILNRTFLYGIGDPGDGSTGSSAGNNSTAWGLIPMLGGAPGTYNSTSVVYDYSANYGAGQLDQAINDVNETNFSAGVRNDFIYLPSPASRSLSRLMKDQIRLVQDETTRGFFVKKITTDLGNELTLVVDQYLSRVNGSIDMVMVDSGRIRLCPFENEYMTYITSPSFRDGDAARCIIKMTLEVRNTGADTGQAHTYIEKVSV